MLETDLIIIIVLVTTFVAAASFYLGRKYEKLLVQHWRDYATTRLITHALNPIKDATESIRFWQRLGATLSPSEELLLKGLAYSVKQNEKRNLKAQSAYSQTIESYEARVKFVSGLQQDIEKGNGDLQTNQALMTLYSKEVTKPTPPKMLPVVLPAQQEIFVKEHGAYLLSMMVKLGHPATVLWLLEHSQYSGQFERKHFAYPSDFSLKPLAAFYSKPYHEAEYADWGAVEQFLLEHTDVNANIGRCSPLLRAIQSHYPKTTIEQFFRYGICVNNYDVFGTGNVYSRNAKFPKPVLEHQPEFTYGYTPLHAIVERWPLVQEEVSYAETNVNPKIFSGKPTLEQYNLQQELEALFDILLHQPGIYLNPVAVRDFAPWEKAEKSDVHGTPLLSLCISKGAAPLAQKLIDRKVPIQSTQTVELGVFYPEQGDMEAVDSSPYQSPNQHLILRSYGSTQEEPERIRPFHSFKNPEPLNYLYTAIICNSELNLIQVLLANGANPNEIYYPGGQDRAEDYPGTTMLHAAIQMQRLDIVQALVEANANIELSARQAVYVYPPKSETERLSRPYPPYARLVDADELAKYDPYDMDNVLRFYAHPLSTPWGYAANLALSNVPDWGVLEDDFFEKDPQKIAELKKRHHGKIDVQRLRNYKAIFHYLSEKGAKKILPHGEVHPENCVPHSSEYRRYQLVCDQFLERRENSQAGEPLTLPERHVQEFISNYQETPYEALGIEFGSNAQEITHAYRQKALQMHSDRNPEKDSQEMSKINVARDLLNNPVSKKFIDLRYRKR